MQDMQEQPVVKKRGTWAVQAISALLKAVLRERAGLTLSSQMVGQNRLSMPDIEVYAMRGHDNPSYRYRTEFDPDTPCRILIVDAGVHNGVRMDIASLAYLLDRAIAADPGHYLRHRHAVKDSDD